MSREGRSEEEYGFSFKEARKKEYECGMCKLEMMTEGERKKRMNLNELVNFVVAELKMDKMLEKRQ